MDFELTILGSGAATPTNSRYPSAQLINFKQKFFLIDCGEGTQLQLRKFKTKFQRINHIFISHLHGDHYLGLPGLLSTFQLLGRKNPLYIYAPANLKSFLELSLSISHSHLHFDLHFIPTQNKEKQLLYEDKGIKIFSFPLIHRIPTTGFYFEELEDTKKIIKEKIDFYDLQIEEIKNIKEGEDIERDGKVIQNKDLTHPSHKLRRYAYCSDTRFSQAYFTFIKGATTLYHEATFLNDAQERAEKTFHSTAEEAAKVANTIGVEKLILGHFSARYRDEEQHVKEAKKLFSETYPANDGEKYLIL